MGSSALHVHSRKNTPTTERRRAHISTSILQNEHYRLGAARRAVCQPVSLPLSLPVTFSIARHSLHACGGRNSGNDCGGTSIIIQNTNALLLFSLPFFFFMSELVLLEGPRDALGSILLFWLCFLVCRSAISCRVCIHECEGA